MYLFLKEEFLKGKNPEAVLKKWGKILNGPGPKAPGRKNFTAPKARREKNTGAEGAGGKKNGVFTG